MSLQQEWTIKRIRDLVQEKFGKRPCWYQLQIARKLWAGKDVVGCARTGAGKTLSFWIPLLMHLSEAPLGFVIVVTPLNLLGKQNADVLNEAGINAVAVSAENASKRLFKRIEQGKYNAIIVSPEILMTHPYFVELWQRPAFAKLLRYIVFDEAHCITQWSTFRNEYAKLGALRHNVPKVPFYVASATLPASTVTGIAGVLRLRKESTEYVMRSNNRPEIALGVRAMKFAASSYRDLDFLIPQGHKSTDPRLPPFVIFFNNTKEAEAACRHLRSRLPKALRNKIPTSAAVFIYHTGQIALLTSYIPMGNCLWL